MLAMNHKIVFTMRLLVRIHKMKKTVLDTKNRDCKEDKDIDLDPFPIIEPPILQRYPTNNYC